MSLTVRELLERESIEDAVILRHGFTDYMRDYEIIVRGCNGPPHADIHKYQFIGCAEARCSTALGSYHGEPTSRFAESLADELVFSGPDYPEKEDPDGFVWGIRQAEVLTDWMYHGSGKNVEQWSKAIGRKMHEVHVGTNAYYLVLVFADVRHSFLGHEPAVAVQKDYPLKVTEVTSDGGIS